MLKIKLGFQDGPLILDQTGLLWSSNCVDEIIHEVLLELFKNERDLFPPSVKDEETLKRAYHCYRAFRRSSDTRVAEHKVDILDIDVVNRWRSEVKKRY